MSYEKSDWYKGLLYAEDMCKQGWYVHSFDAVEQWFAWTYGTSNTKHTAFGENEWLDGVRDYYTNKNYNINRHFEYLGKEFAQVITDSFDELVLK